MELVTALATTIGGVAAFGSLIVAFLMLRATIRFRHEFEVPEQVANIPDFVAREFTRKEFDPPLEVEGEEVHTLKRASILAARAKKNGSFYEESLELGTWQNRYAYELSLALQQVGLMVLCGALPANIVFADIAKTTVEGWVDCRHLVEKRIRGGEEAIDSEESVPYERRHGEWFAMASLLYLRNRGESERVKDLAEMLGGFERVQSREALIREDAQELIPRRTQETLSEVVGV